jgi:cyclic pyranopterin phosphate synthase
MPRLTHLNAEGEAEMVDVSDKAVTSRVAVALARLRMKPATMEEIFAGRVPKGDVLAVARVAGIQAAKRTADLIPLCHPLPISHVGVEFERSGPDLLDVRAECRVTARTGVEMEALTAAAISALTVYDMCKAIDRGMVVESLRLLSKSGGQSGDFTAGDAPT